MRILEEKYGKCSCGAQLAYKDDDIFKNGADSFIVCPCCQMRLYLTEEDLGKPPYVCEECGEEFEAETYIGVDGAEFAICPHCMKETYVDEGIRLNKNNVCFPQHFHKYFGKYTKEISDQKITDWVRNSIANINKENDYYLIASGDTVVFVMKSDQDYHEVTCYVCKKYYECHAEIPAEKF